MSVSVQEQGLLELIAADRERRCSDILGNARCQAADLLRQAHQQARERVRLVQSDARERAQQRVAGASAQRQTRERLAQQSAAAEFLKQALERLPAALERRWQQAQARTSWVRMALQQAHQNLPAGAWRIEHAAGLQAQECEAIATEQGPGPALSLQLNGQLIAGLRIFGNGNCIDASLPGLLSDRENLAAALLQAWEAAR
ncbi:MAG TPA: hypothetical protein VN259_17420 [Xanthomonadales bacterium]|nr:hypothetical protein [Xanthomonadales bacterium]